MAKRKKASELPSLAHHLLLAMPSLTDPHFQRSVTFLCEHNDKGAMGIVINRPLTLTEKELFDHLSIPLKHTETKRHVLAGGPVQTDRGFVLHRPFGEWMSTWHVSDELEITTSRDVLQAIGNGEGPPGAFIALGYAGWGPGQLEKELSENAWLTVPAAAHIVFDVPVEQRWSEAARLLGINPAFLSSETGHA